MHVIPSIQVTTPIFYEGSWHKGEEDIARASMQYISDSFKLKTYRDVIILNYNKIRNVLQ